ncbi:MAG: DUF1631 family protein [Alteromonadaceae bacterium]|nr:DUF1631 family protein [Alteromonadaceae bacterium]
MSSAQTRPPQKRASRAQVSKYINRILAGIRVPDLPYPAGRVAADAEPEWHSLLLSCWTEQRDERVTEVLGSVDVIWTTRQVNAAYLSDRIMDLFLKTSGLHATLVGRIARLRFWLAWQLDVAESAAFSGTLLDWLDHLQEWRGWSDTGGRSARALLDQLDALKHAVAESFLQQTAVPVEAFCQQWLADSRKRMSQASRLRERLLETETGAARQRLADQVARALIGRALTGRQLPEAISRFILQHWYPVLKQTVWLEGTKGDLHRHANKLLEWLVWAGDPQLSRNDRSRLYHVGEQIEERVRDVWRRAMDTEPPSGVMDPVQAEIVARVRGDEPVLQPALSDSTAFTWDISWLSMEPADPELVKRFSQHWYVEGEGAGEQRRFFFALLEPTNEILWTNGVGARLGLQFWHSFDRSLAEGTLKALPEPTPFGEVLEETVLVLARVCNRQQKQREAAAAQARERAEALRRQKQEAEEQRRQAEARRQAEQAEQQARAEQQRLEDEQAREAEQRRQQEQEVGELVDGLGLGGWIAVARESGAEPVRLKLAVKIAASNKFVFVDRLGLNRTEYRFDELVAGIIDGTVRLLGKAAEFDDTLSRVVGRIRVGRN